MKKADCILESVEVRNFDFCEAVERINPKEYYYNGEKRISKYYDNVTEFACEALENGPVRFEVEETISERNGIVSYKDRAYNCKDFADFEKRVVNHVRRGYVAAYRLV